MVVWFGEKNVRKQAPSKTKKEGKEKREGDGYKRARSDWILDE